MNVSELIGKRFLATEKQGYGTTVTELKAIELSPSGQWVKIMNMHGNKSWRKVTDLSLVEILTVAPAEPKPAN